MEVTYGCQYTIDQEEKKGSGRCNSSTLTGSTIKKTGAGGVDENGKFVWEQTFSRPSNHNDANIRNTGLQFTGTGSTNCNYYITKTVTGVSIVWPQFNGSITIQAIQDLGGSLMDHLPITDHSLKVVIGIP